MSASAVPGLATPGLAIPGYYGGAEPVAVVPAFTIAAVTGDSSGAGQALNPGAPWQALATVTASNGVNHAADVVLTVACLTSTTAAVAPTATASSATDLSGAILGMQLSAPSPIPAVSGVTPAWPGRMVLEAAFGSGFETPDDEREWTVLSDSVPSPGAVKRFWSWADDSGVPYTLGQLQSSSGSTQLDNADGALTPSNAASEYFPDVTTGTPIRLRSALGTVGGTPVNRWYVFARNMLSVPEKRNQALRNYVDVALTDVWSVAGKSCPTPYRGEVLQDSPYAWWPLDDQPGAGGVLPTALNNAAIGNTNTLNVSLSPLGGVATAAYGTNGTSYSANYIGQQAGIANYAVGASSGWMYGDPPVSPGSTATGNPVTANPGSNAWTQSGAAGNTGSYGWFLSVRDPDFPPLSGGITVKAWFNYLFYATSAAVNVGGLAHIAGQPVCPLTILELATDTEPVAILQLDTSGHLNLITYNGGTPTSNGIYTSSDLRCEAWHEVSMTLTETTWQVWVDAGATGSASGTATGMTPAWTWLVANGDMGSGGGGTTSNLVHGGNVSLSHIAVFPEELPYWRVVSQYWAAITGFGILPTPTSLALQAANGPGSGANGGTWTPDGALQSGLYGRPVSTDIPFSFCAIVSATAGTYTSGTSVRATVGAIPTASLGDYVWASWTGVAPRFNVYTDDQLGTETEAAVCTGNSDAFSSGYGSGASGSGSGQLSAGSGASPPTGPSSIGDTVQQRIERCLSYGSLTYPNRSIDPAALLCQAALDVGGQQAGANIQNVQQSDNGLLYVDSLGAVSYRDRPHLAADSVVWSLSSAGPQFGYPFQQSQNFENDPQKVINVIGVTPYSPAGASVAVITPSDATAVNASQQQYGPRPYAVNSYIQSTSEQQAQADWLFDSFGTLHRRVSTLTVDAAGYPPAWLLVCGANCGDLVEITDLPMVGGPLSVGIYRISSLSRRIAFGANQSRPEGSITLVCDYEPASYWS